MAARRARLGVPNGCPALPHATHLVLIPSYNSGSALARTVRAASGAWGPVWVVIDGSTDGSDAHLQAADHVIRRARNAGKGAAVLQGIEEAGQAGFTHALVMDGDGQHSAASIAPLMAASQSHTDAVILGRPVFGPDAPLVRVLWRRVSNALTAIETNGAGIGDGLFGLRVYPIAPLCAVMAQTRWMRRFDFDPEAVVRLAWRGAPMQNIDVPVRYFRREEGGVSHFRYGRDNLLLAGMHARLLATAVRRWISPG